MLLEVERRLSKLEHLLKSLMSTDMDEAILAMLFEHLCIRISGNIEVGVREILRTYTQTRANPEVLRYVEKRLASFQNPKTQRIIDLLSDYNAAWGKDFDDFAKTDDLKDKLDSIAANRNLIAHGKSTGISASRIAAFNDVHRKILTFINALVLKGV